MVVPALTVIMIATAMAMTVVLVGAWGMGVADYMLEVVEIIVGVCVVVVRMVAHAGFSVLVACWTAGCSSWSARPCTTWSA